jgi:hypothetical protein
VSSDYIFHSGIAPQLDVSFERVEPVPEILHSPDLDLLTKQQLAQRLKVSTRSVSSWYQSGVIPGRKLSYKIVRYSLPDVLTALESRQRLRTARCGRPYKV